MSQLVGTTDTKREILKERVWGKGPGRYARNRVDNHECGGTKIEVDEDRCGDGLKGKGGGRRGNSSAEVT